MLDAAPAGDGAERLFRLAEIADSRAAKRMSHASTNSLPAPRTRPSICAMVTRRLALEMTEQERDRRFAGQLRRFLPVLLYPGHVDVGMK